MFVGPMSRPQRDFFPGGALPLPKSMDTLRVVNNLIKTCQFDYVIATRLEHQLCHGYAARPPPSAPPSVTLPPDSTFAWFVRRSLEGNNPVRGSRSLVAQFPSSGLAWRCVVSPVCAQGRLALEPVEGDTGESVPSIILPDYCIMVRGRPSGCRARLPRRVILASSRTPGCVVASRARLGPNCTQSWSYHRPR